MRTLRTLSLSVAALLLCALSWASTIVYTFKAVDDSGAPVPGATLTQNTVKSLQSATLGNAVAGLTLTPIDLANGDYGIAYDPEGTSGEIIVNFTASKAGSTLTGQNASISINLTKDSSRVLNADVAVSTRNSVVPANPTDYARNNTTPQWYAAPPALPSTYPLAANDELLLGYLYNMVDPNGGTPRYKAPALALAPTGTGGAAVDPFAAVTSTVYPTGTFGSLLKTSLANPVPLPLDFVTALYGTHRWQNLEAAQVGALANNPATGVATFTRFDGTTFSVPVTLDSLGRITSRPAASQ